MHLNDLAGLTAPSQPSHTPSENFRASSKLRKGYSRPNPCRRLCMDRSIARRACCRLLIYPFSCCFRASAKFLYRPAQLPSSP